MFLSQAFHGKVEKISKYVKEDSKKKNTFSIDCFLFLQNLDIENNIFFIQTAHSVNASLAPLAHTKNDLFVVARTNTNFYYNTTKMLKYNI